MEPGTETYRRVHVCAAGNRCRAQAKLKVHLGVNAARDKGVGVIVHGHRRQQRAADIPPDREHLRDVWDTQKAILLGHCVQQVLRVSVGWARRAVHQATSASRQVEAGVKVVEYGAQLLPLPRPQRAEVSVSAHADEHALDIQDVCSIECAVQVGVAKHVH